MIPSNDLDIFPEGDPSSTFSRSYWKQKLNHGDIVDKISKTINANDFKPAPDKYPQQPSDFFQEGASVEIDLKPRDKQKESLDFFKAQLDLSKDILPKQTTATKAPPVPTEKDAQRPKMDLFDMQWHRDEDFASYNGKTLSIDCANKTTSLAEKNEMTISPNTAFDKVYPHGNPNQPSAAMKPTPKGDINCPHCKNSFNYNLQNETQMGAVACPSCGRTVTQANFETQEPIIVKASDSGSD